MKTYSRLSPQERDLLAFWQVERLTLRECARRLGRNVSSLSRELKRNGWKEGYVAIHAQGRADEREKEKAHGKQELKNGDVYEYVTEKLRGGWSPDQIAGRLRRDHPQDRHWWICHETIYRWIYEQKQVKADQPWYEYLRRKQKKRKQYKGRKVHRSHIPDRISIHKRPKVIDRRKEFGHWEGDTIEGKGHKGGIHTEVERVSRFIAGSKVRAGTGEEAVKVQEDIFGELPAEARKSTTLDNGRETHLHFKLRTNLNMQTYHADPYSSWQRGTNEHGNWHIRYYFPKGTDFNEVSEEELQEVIAEINHRPRKILKYQTATEVFTKKLQETQLLR